MKPFFKTLARLVFLCIAVPLTLVGFLVASIVRGVRAGGGLLDTFLDYLD